MREEWKRSFYIFIISMALVNLFTSGLHAYLVLFYTLIKMNTEVVGLIVAVSSLTVIPFIPLGGVIGDRIGRKKVLMMTPIISSGSYIILSIATGPFMVFISLILDSIPMALASPAIRGYLRDICPDEESLKWATGKMNAMWSLLFIVGGPTLGGIIEAFKLLFGNPLMAYRVVFLLVAVFEIAAGLTRKFLRDVRNEHGGSIKESYVQFKRLLKSREFNGYLFLSLVNGFAMQLIYMFISLYLSTIYNLNEFEIGLVLCGGSMVYVLSSLAYSSRKPATRWAGVAMMGGGIFSVAFLGLPFVFFLAIYLMAGMFESLVDLGTEVGLSVQIPEKGRGGVFGIISMINNAVYIPSSYMAGFMWKNYGGSLTIGTGGLIRIAAGIIFCLAVISRQENRNISQKNERLCNIRNT